MESSFVAVDSLPIYSHESNKSIVILFHWYFTLPVTVQMIGEINTTYKIN